MELEEKSAVHMCGTRKTSFRVPAGLLHGGLSVPVCLGPGSLLVNTSSAHRSRGNWLVCIARGFIASQTVPQFDLCQRVNEPTKENSLEKPKKQTNKKKPQKWVVVKKNCW